MPNIITSPILTSKIIGSYLILTVSLLSCYDSGDSKNKLSNETHSRQDVNSKTTSRKKPTHKEKATKVDFKQITNEAGINISNISGSPEQGFISETMSAGVAAFDANGDGYMDLFTVGGTKEGLTTSSSSHNLLINQRNGTFLEQTHEAGLYYEGWGMGTAVGDTDNDGDVDLYVTYLGTNQFYINDGNAKFTEQGGLSGIGDSNWGSSAAFGDLNNDGLLDLYVTNYVEFSFENPPGGKLKCSYKGLNTFCGPQGMKSSSDILYRNEGKNKFSDISKQTTVADYMLPALGVALSDIDNDGDLDIYIANDSERNLFFNNLKHWSFKEQAIESGLAYSENGRAQAGMGVDAADYDEDGDIDFYVTNFSDDVNTLYQNQGNGTFIDNTYAAGLGSIIRPYLGWATGFYDFDRDGDLDIFVANGHIYPQLNTFSDGLSYPQVNLLYRNESGYYKNVVNPLGWESEKVTRSAALIDYDNDGDKDIIFVNLNDKIDLLRNELSNSNTWIGIKLTGTKSNRDAIGARITMISNQRTRMREVQRGRGFQSQFDPRIIFGFQPDEKIIETIVSWPSGLKQTFKDIPLKTYLQINEGSMTVTALNNNINNHEAKRPYPSDPKDSEYKKNPEPPFQIRRDGWKARDYANEGRKLYEEGRYDRAKFVLEYAYKLAPQNPAIQINLATVLFHGYGAYAKVAQILKQTIIISPKNSAAYLLLGKAQLRSNLIDEAITTFKRAVATDSTNWETNNWLGLAYIRNKQPRNAIKFFTDATIIAPWLPTPHLHLANAFSLTGNNAQAVIAKKNFDYLKPLQEQVDQYLEKVKVFPDSSRAQTLLALAYAEQGRHSIALRHFNLALQSDSTFSPAYHGVGRIYFRNGDMELAIRNFEQACRWNQKYIPALIDLGKAYYKIKEWDRAIGIYSYVLKLGNDTEFVKTNLAMSFAMKGNITAAKRYFSEAIHDNPQDVSALDGMAQIHESEGERSEAKLIWEKISKLDPDHIRAKNKLNK